MTFARTGFLTISLLALAASGCTSSRFSPADTRPAPLPAAPAGTVSSGSLPPPAAPGTDPSQFPPPPGSQAGTDVASLPPESSGPPAGAVDINKNALLGSWKTSSGGAGCQMFLTLTKYGSASRGGTRGCSGELANMRSWDVQGKQVVLFDESGSTIARLYASGADRYDGQTNSGQPVSLSR